MRLTLTLPSVLLFTFHLCAQWEPMNTGMQSSRSLCEKDGDLYCASYTHGVKKSIGGTGPFTDVNNGLPSVGGIIYSQSVGSDGAYVYVGTESGIYRSGDGGASWNSINGTLTANTAVYANKFFAIGSNIMAVFAGSVGQGGGIWRSGNFGNTWLIGHSGMGSNVVVNHLTQVGGTLWASTSVGLYTSTDNAQNWTAHPTVNYAVYSLASLNNSLVIACSYGMRYSTNGGTSWQDATGDPTAPTSGQLVAFDGALFSVLNSPTGCLRSLDNGVTWSDFNSGFSFIDAQAQEEFSVVGNTLYCTALFDVYALPATGTGIRQVPTSIASIFPTVFDESFTLRNHGAGGTLLLMDALGRLVRSVRVGARSDLHVDRSGLAAGSYHAVFQQDGAGIRSDVGTVIAR